jgi:hypothetical protein
MTEMKRTRAPHFTDQSPEARRERARVRDRARDQTPERRAAQLARSRTPRVKALARAYNQTPRAMAADRAYHKTPKAKAAALARSRTPEYKAVHRAYMQTPEGVAKTAANLYKMPIEIPDRSRPENCECCGETPDKTLHFDHCHATGRFRGWCCQPCNNGAGIMDDPKRLRLRALYVERPFQPGPINWAYPAPRYFAPCACHAQTADARLTQTRMRGARSDVRSGEYRSTMLC